MKPGRTRFVQAAHVFVNIFVVATTVHIPPDLLKSVDQRAKQRRISRNRLIVEALRSTLDADRSSQRVPQSFLDEMKRWREDAEGVKLIDKMLRQIKSSRRSKKPMRL